VNEWGFEKKEDYPWKRESNKYDRHSVHFAAIRQRDDQVVGTVRIILDTGKTFPIEEHCTITADLSHLDRRKLGEISRLAVTKEYRRRIEDKVIFNEAPGSKVKQIPVPDASGGASTTTSS